jgi:hypothetical protein
MNDGYGESSTDEPFRADLDQDYEIKIDDPSIEPYREMMINGVSASVSKNKFELNTPGRVPERMTLRRLNRDETLKQRIREHKSPESEGFFDQQETSYFERAIQKWEKGEIYPWDIGNYPHAWASCINGARFTYNPANDKSSIEEENINDNLWIAN